jgi:hypothetical protein
LQLRKVSIAQQLMIENFRLITWSMVNFGCHM